MTDVADAGGDRAAVLMVCTGNIGRSPMMERILRHSLVERGVRWVDVASAGTLARPGQPMEPGAAQALAEMGLDASGFRSTPLAEKAVTAADLILVATRDHRGEVVSMVPSAVRRAFTLHELARIASAAPAPPGGVATATGQVSVQQFHDAVAWAGQLRGSGPRPDVQGADDLLDPLGAPVEVYRERAMAISASVERIASYLLGETSAG